jgi:hypothetical protein
MALTKLPKAGLATGSVSTSQIEDGTIQNQEFEDSTLTSAKLADSTIANAKLSNSTFTLNGQSIALGASGTFFDGELVEWQSVVTTNTTMVAGRGYFVNTTGGEVTMTLPASATIGDTISIKDYAENFGSNKVIIGRNGHNIQGVANNSDLSTNRASVTLVYVDATKGWLYTDEHNVGSLTVDPQYVTATGGTESTSGDYKIHKFTSSGNFVVSNAGLITPAGGSTDVSYMVVAGGGGGGTVIGGGGGGGGYREGKVSGQSPWTTSPLAASSGITMATQTYPVTVGGGGAVVPGYNNAPSLGNPSIFSTITSAGGGAGTTLSHNSAPIGVGGSGGGSAYNSTTQYAGNTPPVSPPQGNPGGGGENGPNYAGGGGGGAGGAGATGNGSSGGNGGAGTVSHISGTPTTYSAGGGGSGSSNNNQPGGTGTPGVSGSGMRNSPFVAATCGAVNTGGGGGGKANGGPSPNHDNSTGGGSGIVIIRYKYQN